MSEIKTQVKRSEWKIVSQNKVVRNYAQQLKSSVISNERRREILKNLRLELMSEQLRRPEKRSAEAVPRNEYFSSAGIMTAVDSSKKITVDTLKYSENAVRVQTAQIKPWQKTTSENSAKYSAPNSNYQYSTIQKSVDNTFIHSQRQHEYIQTARVNYSEDVKAVISQSKQMDSEKKQNEELQRRKFAVKIVGLRRLRYKRYRVTSISTVGEAVSPAVPKQTHSRSQAVIRAIGIKELSLENSRLNIAAADTDNSVAIESAELIRSAVDTAAQTGGTIRTAVKTTARGVEAVRTVAKSGIKIGTAKDVGRLATAAAVSVKNIAADGTNQLLKTKIDKSNITDTGTETIKQGLTELRYADNARRAVLNTARTTVKAGYAVKNMPKDTRVQVRQIKKNVQKVKAAAEKTAMVLKKIIFSKEGLLLILIIFLLLLIVVLFNGLITVIVTAITSLFSFLVSEDGKETEEILDGYSSSIVEFTDEKQSEIDEIVEGFVCDKRQYPPYDEITELNQFGNSEIDLPDENEVTAILAVLRYREMQEDGEDDEVKFEFTDEEIQEVIQEFFEFDYHYEYGECSYPYCKQRTYTEVYNQGTPYEFTVETTEYYCDEQHEWLYGEVTNFSADEVMDKYEFTDEEKKLYNMYLAQLEAMTGDDENA